MLPGDHLYLTHRPTIERILRFIARRHRCDADEAEDFGAWARLKLIDNDCAILAQYQGRADIGSYLLVVVQRLFLDYRISKWGAWRPSAEARRLGPLAVRLETLRGRDGLSLEEAYQTLHAIDPELEREVLDDLEARLPVRVPRRFEGEAVLQTVADARAAPEAAAIEEEAAARKRQAGAAVRELMDGLAPQEQIILRLRFAEGMQIADVARTLHLDARPLYRRIEQLLAELRRGLAARGLRGEDLGWGADVRTARGTQRRLGEAGGDGKDARRTRLLGDGGHRHG
jgi:RNA polymerase sigma factor for flagellar operon FliA